MSTPSGGRPRPAQGRTSPRGRPPARLPARSRLRVVPARARQPRAGTFAALLVAILAGGLVGLLVLNTAMQRSAFELDELRDRAESLGVRQQVLDLRVEGMRAPERLARAASALGMVPMSSPVFLRLEDGRVLGDPVPAVAGTGPRLVPEPPATPPAPTGPAAPRTVPEPVRTPTGGAGGVARAPEEPQQPLGDTTGGGR